MKAIIAIAICFALVGAQNWNTTFSTSGAQNGASCCVPSSIGFALNSAATVITVSYTFPSPLSSNCSLNNITGNQIDTLLDFSNGTYGFTDPITEMSYLYLPAPYNNYTVTETNPTICTVTVIFNNGSNNLVNTYLAGSNYTASCAQIAINLNNTINSSAVVSSYGVATQYETCTFGITPSGSSASKIALGAFAVLVSFLALF